MLYFLTVKQTAQHCVNASVQLRSDAAPLYAVKGPLSSAVRAFISQRKRCLMVALRLHMYVHMVCMYNLDIYQKASTQCAFKDTILILKSTNV